MTLETTPLRGHFLVAMPHMADPNFHKTVVLLCEHNEEGAMGVIINRPLPFTMGQVYEGQGIKEEAHQDRHVNFGGPVQPQVGFLVYEGVDDYPSSMLVGKGVYLGTSLEILQDIAAGVGPGRWIFALGYAGWGAEQLEGEIARNDWLVVPLDADLIFKVDPAERWTHAVRSLGIEPSLISSLTGSA